MLPGKTYSAEEIVRMILGKWWLVTVLVVVGATGSWIVSRSLVDTYRSETLILVVPQRVPESYVKSTVTATIEDRLPTISQQILSRTRLERIILDMNLYPDMRQSLSMEEVVARMRTKDIDVAIDKGQSSFHVSYVSHDPNLAQQVTARLASLFIEENTKDREMQAEDTSQFLDSQLAEQRQQLLETEKALEEYNRRFSGQLPSQAATNLQAIQSAQLSLQNLADATNREREHRLLLERQIADLDDPDPTVNAGVVLAGGPPDVVSEEPVAAQLEAARAKLRALEARVTADHPDVKATKRSIQDLEARQAEEAKKPATAGPAPVSKPATQAELLRQRRARELQGQIDSIDRDLADKQAQEKQLRREIADYQAKLEAVPARESELVELTRDYDTQRSQYQALLTKREDSKLAANLERRNIGEQFKVLDPARVPEKPFSPKRPVIYLAGPGGGLALALLLIGFVEYRDSSLKLESDVTRLLQLPVLAVVPVIGSPEGQTLLGRLALWRSPR